MIGRLAGPAMAITAVIGLLTAQAAAQRSAVPRDKRSVHWAQAVQAHAAGTTDAPLETVAAWSHTETMRVLRSAPVVLYDAPFLHRAVTLHTDIAMVERARFDSQLPRALVGKTLFADPTRADAVERAFQWSAARLLADKLAADPAGGQMALQWYRATSAMLQQWGDCATLRPHVQAALKRWPDDPTLLLVEGTLHQTFADVRVQRYVDGAAERARPPVIIGGTVDPAVAASLGINGRVSGPKLTGVAARIGVVDLDTELDRAEHAFRRALVADATLAEARVRLAHVQLRRNRPADALATLEPLSGTSLPSALAYYEAMVRGRTLDAVGRQREALTVFERATAIRPGAQSARLAISRQMLVDGHATDGLRVLDDALGPGARRGDDPWYDYFRFHEPDAWTLLADFRAMAQ